VERERAHSDIGSLTLGRFSGLPGYESAVGRTRRRQGRVGKDDRRGSFLARSGLLASCWRAIGITQQPPSVSSRRRSLYIAPPIELPRRYVCSSLDDDTIGRAAAAALGAVNCASVTPLPIEAVEDAPPDASAIC